MESASTASVSREKRVVCSGYIIGTTVPLVANEGKDSWTLSVFNILDSLGLERFKNPLTTTSEEIPLLSIKKKNESPFSVILGQLIYVLEMERELRKAN